MTETPQDFPPTHPVARLGRVIQQLRSFGDLHARELEALASDLPEDVAARVRIYRDIQRDEASMVIDELLDIQAAVIESTTPPAPDELLPGAAHDPAINSARRAKWLADQAAEAERLRQPISRRDFLAHGPAKGEEDETSPA